ncbi:MAG: formylglycine-generating enzyme family protein, partial [Methylocella sp.]
TEAEWEYAARAGTKTAYSWGDKIGEGNANCAGCGSQWDGREIAPAGSFKPNAFGLYDMHGNVWEWVEDCYRANYESTPAGGPELTAGACPNRAVRGGSWDFVPQLLRAAARFGFTTDFRSLGLGFRVGRMLIP